MEDLLSRKGLREFLKGKVNGPLKMHHEFRVSISDCPNACSRPQIVDIGLIGANEPSVSDELCSQCGTCVEVCREAAIELDVKGPVVHSSKCVACGQCVSICPTGTLRGARQGYRILIGGKLGRHPQLGRELPGIHAEEEALRIVSECLDHYIRNNREGERFGDVINRTELKD
jgi:dissimilatory sulfite reductase (desulfoviridin) alpha/beta subunit